MIGDHLGMEVIPTVETSGYRLLPRVTRLNMIPRSLGTIGMMIPRMVLGSNDALSFSAAITDVGTTPNDADGGMASFA